MSESTSQNESTSKFKVHTTGTNRNQYEGLSYIAMNINNNNNNNKSQVNGNIESEESLQLHKAIFEDNFDKFSSILKDRSNSSRIDVSHKDKHGNTPLHLAVMLGRSLNYVDLLLSHGARVDSKNLNRWTPFAEACSYGNRETITALTKHLKYEFHGYSTREEISKTLEKIQDFRLELKWEFQTWIPFLSRVLPSDICVITKRSSYIKVDTTLVDFERLAWRRGDIRLLFSSKNSKQWVIMDNITKKFQSLGGDQTDSDTDDKVDGFMSNDIIDIELKTKDTSFTRSTRGWIWKADKTEKVGRYNADFYHCDNLLLVTKKRREHLSDEDIKRNKAFIVNMAGCMAKDGQIKPTEDHDDSSSPNNSSMEESDDSKEERLRRVSLAPPSKCSISWDQYISSPPNEHPQLGRVHVCKTTTTVFKANIAMSRDFPLSKTALLEILSVIPLKHFRKMRDFIEMKLPEGFPVKIDIPIIPALVARITFEDFQFLDGPFDESQFTIPDDFTEEPKLFPIFS